MKHPTKKEIDAALAAIEEIRGARARRATLHRTLEKLKESEPLLAMDSIGPMVECQRILAEIDRLNLICADPYAFLHAALQYLRELNDIHTASVVTQEIATVALNRLDEGYRVNQVSMMIGCTSGTVSRLAKGTYRFSSKPASERSRQRPMATLRMKTF